MRSILLIILATSGAVQADIVLGVIRISAPQGGSAAAYGRHGGRPLPRVAENDDARTRRVDAPVPGSVPVTATEDARTSDRGQMLREAFELLGDGDLAAGLRAMQRSVADASVAVLGDLDAQCRAARGIPLDALLAKTRIYLASRVGHGRGFRLNSATKYERAALGRMLARQAETLLGREHDGRTVAEWASQLNEYGALKPDARLLVADAARAGALLAARLRFDPALKEKRAETVRLTRLRADLMHLAGWVASLPGYMDLSPDDGWVDPVEPPIAGLAAASQPSGSDCGGPEADSRPANSEPSAE